MSGSHRQSDTRYVEITDTAKTRCLRWVGAVHSDLGPATGALSGGLSGQAAPHAALYVLMTRSGSELATRFDFLRKADGCS